MKIKIINQLIITALCSLTLGSFKTAQAFELTPELAVQYTYFLFNGSTQLSDVTVTLPPTPAQFNLLSYVAEYPASSKMSSQKGLVDANGLYTIVNGTIVTNPDQTQYFLNHSTPYPTLPAGNIVPIDIPASMGNLNARLLDDNRFIYIDQDNRYAVTNPYGNPQLVNISLIPLIGNAPSTFFYYYLGLSGGDINVSVKSPISLDQVKSSLDTISQNNSNAKKQIYVIGNVNCPVCKDFYDGMLPYTDSKEVTVNWALVSLSGFLGANDINCSWTIMEGKTPTNNQGFIKTPRGALAYNEYYYSTDPDVERGGISLANAGITNPKSKTAYDFDQNFKFFLYNAALIGVPVIFYKDITNQELVLVGPPNDYAEFVASIHQ